MSRSKGPEYVAALAGICGAKGQQDVCLFKCADGKFPTGDDCEKRLKERYDFSCSWNQLRSINYRYCDINFENSSFQYQWKAQIVVPIVFSDGLSSGREFVFPDYCTFGNVRTYLAKYVLHCDPAWIEMSLNGRPPADNHKISKEKYDTYNPLIISFGLDDIQGVRLIYRNAYGVTAPFVVWVHRNQATVADVQRALSKHDSVCPSFCIKITSGDRVLGQTENILERVDGSDLFVAFIPNQAFVKLRSSDPRRAPECVHFNDSRFDWNSAVSDICRSLQVPNSRVRLRFNDRIIDSNEILPLLESTRVSPIYVEMIHDIKFMIPGTDQPKLMAFCEDDHIDFVKQELSEELHESELPALFLQSRQPRELVDGTIRENIGRENIQSVTINVLLKSQDRTLCVICESEVEDVSINLSLTIRDLKMRLKLHALDRSMRFFEVWREDALLRDERILSSFYRDGMLLYCFDRDKKYNIRVSLPDGIKILENVSPTDSLTKITSLSPRTGLDLFYGDVKILDPQNKKFFQFIFPDPIKMFSLRGSRPNSNPRKPVVVQVQTTETRNSPPREPPKVASPTREEKPRTVEPRKSPTRNIRLNVVFPSDEVCEIDCGCEETLKDVMVKIEATETFKRELTPDCYTCLDERDVSLDVTVKVKDVGGYVFLKAESGVQLRIDGTERTFSSRWTIGDVRKRIAEERGQSIDAVLITCDGSELRDSDKLESIHEDVTVTVDHALELIRKAREVRPPDYEQQLDSLIKERRMDRSVCGRCFNMCKYNKAETRRALSTHA